MQQTTELIQELLAEVPKFRFLRARGIIQMCVVRVTLSCTTEHLEKFWVCSFSLSLVHLSELSKSLLSTKLLQRVKKSQIHDQQVLT